VERDERQGAWVCFWRLLARWTVDLKTNGRSEPGIGIGFISQFSNKWSGH